ncbi:MAG TPA: MBL fold metallo-hydrolase [Candidatus Tectomicrobia bacterium]|jgi:glyoxylase-like metal-dependent hydrolase (beta-lactamase superfamily II)
MDRRWRWQVGEVRITRVQELEAPGMRFIVPQATIDHLAAIPWLTPFLAANGDAMGSVHALLLEVADRRIIVDTCIGNDKERRIPPWNRRQGPFLATLEAAGYPPDSIDTVICTHLHTDHVGWNTRLVDGQWVPTFPRARYLVARPEWEHWSQSEDRWTQIVMADSVRPILAAGLVDLVEVDHVVHETIRFEPTPGHTPGHVSVHIVSHGEEAVITGDLVHHPCQFARPEWGSSADTDAVQADRTRKAFMARYADTPTLIIGTHFAGPTAGRLVCDGAAYRLEV